MRFREIRILADENISPKVVAYLRTQELEILDVKEQGWQGKLDNDLLDIAFQDKRWILTYDSDFGTLAIHEGQPFYGVIFLRVKNMRSPHVINVCSQLLDHKLDFSQRALIIVEDNKIRIRYAHA